MQIFKKSKKKQAEAERQRRRGTTKEPLLKSFLNRHALVTFLLYLAFGLAAVLIAFAGLSPAGPLVQNGQVSRIRITAEIPFSYTSTIRTNERLDAIGKEVPPVFRLDLAPLRNFRSWMERFVEDLTTFAKVPENTPANLARLSEAEVQTFLRDYPAGNPYNFRPSDVATLYNQLGPEDFKSTLNEGLIIIGDLFQKGVYEEDSAFANQSGQRLTLFNVEDELGNLQEVEILSEEEGQRALRIQLMALDIPRESTFALARVLRSALEPNLVFDAERTQRHIEEAQAMVEPVRIGVRQGETVIEPNSRVTDLQFEQLEAYRRALRESEAGNFGFNSLFFERALLTVLLVAGAAFFLKSSRSRVRTDHRLFVLSGAMILLNVLLLRLIIELGDGVIAETNPIFLQLLPYLLPVMLGPIIITILVGTGPGILSVGVISTVNAMMQGNSLSVLLLSQLVGLVAIAYCRNIQFRASLVRAGTIAGGTMAVGAILFGIRDEVGLTIVLYQVMASVATGALSGMFIVGLLPVFEQIFKTTTDITLLELTDYNHQLLRKMQIEAPGSYHHSLMVANLSENAAAAIGANPLVCRVCSLFHDIGKMVKPEYFVENQRSGHNPHIETNPSMSALVIKSHVKEGIQMARQYKLPVIIQDVIQQQHGTSLIQYFYYKALEKQQSEANAGSIYPGAPKIELNEVNEATYRYEGPVPQFTESAIIMLADCVEAASRSLKKVNPQSIDELIDKIFLSRLQDGQLDATPLTFIQLKKIKESFSFTILNTLHSRIEYPDQKPGAGNGKGRGKPKATRTEETMIPNES